MKKYIFLKDFQEHKKGEIVSNLPSFWQFYLLKKQVIAEHNIQTVILNQIEAKKTKKKKGKK